MEANIHAWTRWAVSNGINQDIIGFLNFRNEYLYVAPQDEYDNFPNPRGWSRLSVMIDSGKDMDCNEVLTARVGGAACVEFQAYRKELKNMPNIDKLLAGEEVFEPSKKAISISYAVALAVGGRVLNDAKLVEPACEVMKAIPTEIAALFFTQVLSQPDDKFLLSMLKSEGIKTWVKKHAKLLSKYGFQR
jgi:hypothetical protein